MFRRSAFAALLALLCCAVSADAQTVLTADRVLELAARQNPDVLIARTRTVQAEGGLATAQIRLPANPEVDAFVGSRDNTLGRRSGEYEFSFAQRFGSAASAATALPLHTAGVTQRTGVLGRRPFRPKRPRCQRSIVPLTPKRFAM